MAKTIKLLSLLLAMCMCFSGLVACEHKHDTVLVEIIEATCYSPRKERYVCEECGAEETMEFGEPGEHYWVSATCEKPKHCSFCNITEGSIIDHTYEYGKCTMCYEWMPLDVTMPETPITITDGSQIMKFTSFYEGWKFGSNTSFNLYLYYDCESILGYENGAYFSFNYKVLDKDGYVVGSGTASTTKVTHGDKLRDQVTDYPIAYKLDPNGSYTIIIYGD